MVNYNFPPSPSKFFDGVLYEAMLEDLQLAGMSQRTVHGYLRAVRQLADWAETPPDKITEFAHASTPTQARAGPTWRS